MDRGGSCDIDEFGQRVVDGVSRLRSLEVRTRRSDDNKLNSRIGGGLRYWGLAGKVSYPENHSCSRSWFREGDKPGFYDTMVVNGSRRKEEATGIDTREWWRTDGNYDQNCSTLDTIIAKWPEPVISLLGLVLFLFVWRRRE